jgi:membrane associated rhomboid family serine protease
MPSDDPATGEPTRAPKVREPVFDAPLVVVALVGVLIAIQAAISLASNETRNFISDQYAFIPERLSLALWPVNAGDLLARANQASILFKSHLQQGGAKPWTLLTYAFLHGSWTHVGLNSIWLIAFGPPVARRLGSLRFLALFAATAIAGALFHWAFNLMDPTRLIGASAADSGLMAAAARFIFEPGGPLGGPGGFSRSSPGRDYNAPAPPLRELLAERNPAIFLVIWLATNFAFGPFAQELGLSEAPVAWLAHLGGFAFGLLLFPLFDRRPPS